VDDPATRAVALPRIAIVGGGITGLTAAHRIHELLPQAELSLFEAGPRLGGVLETVSLHGFLIERSADSFLTKLSRTIELCHRLGMADELLSTDETRRRAFVVRHGKLVPIPSGFYLMSPRKLGPLLASPLLSLPGKLRILAEPFVPRGPASAASCGDSRTGGAPDESVASFARRRLGREAFDRLVQPLVSGIYTADPEKLSMAATMPEFLAEERDQGSLVTAARRAGYVKDRTKKTASGARYNLFAAPKGGLGNLVAALAARLPPKAIQLNTPVSNITKTIDGRWQVDFASNVRSPLTETHKSQSTFDAVIVAVPAHVAAELFQYLDRTLAGELSAIEYAGCHIVSLAYKRDQIGDPLDGFGFVVPKVERRRIIAASYASQKFPGRAPTDAVLIRTFIGGALQPDLLDLSDDELRRIAIEELKDLLAITGFPMLADIARWPHSMPQYHVGHIARVARIEALAQRHSALALAGNAYHGVGIPQCIESAESAAERVVGALS
jgi:oxygen-dependent protoporphyrinogen oxidase